jgi:tetratricopeptide (TPR) repeat protein
MSASAQALLIAAEQALGRLDLEQGLELAERALVLGRSAEHSQALGWALMVLARIRAAMGGHHHQLRAYANALEAYELLGERGDIERQLMALNVCAMIRWEAGDSREAIQWLDQGIGAARQHGLQTPWVKMLRSMAALLSEGDEHLEAIRCCDEAIAVLQERSQQDGQIGVFLAQKAQIRVELAERMATQGAQQADIDRLRAQAASEMPALPTPNDGHPYFFKLSQLQHSMPPLLKLGLWSQARQATASLSRFEMHLSGRGRRKAYWALGTWHQHRGHTGRAIAYLQRAIECAERAGDGQDLDDFTLHIEQLHAQAGDFRSALLAHQVLLRRRTAKAAAEHTLRARLSVIQRESMRRVQRVRDAQSHDKRLAVIGRLIAQTHHALHEPIVRVAGLLAQARGDGDLLIDADADAGIDVFRRTLVATVDQIDAASVLISQLRLYSYRSASQAGMVGLRSALQEAWGGMAALLGGGNPSRPMSVDGSTEARVWCDAQRLGILLQVLFIELMRQPQMRDSGAAVRALVQAGGDRLVRVRITWPAAQDCGIECSLVAEEALPLGMVLCGNIVTEMHGRLHVMGDAAGLSCFELELPQTDSLQGPALPRSLKTAG